MIPKGYKLLVANPRGEIVDEVDIGEMDISRPFGRASVAEDVERAVTLDINAQKKAEKGGR